MIHENVLCFHENIIITNERRRRRRKIQVEENGNSSPANFKDFLSVSHNKLFSIFNHDSHTNSFYSRPLLKFLKKNKSFIDTLMSNNCLPIISNVLV